ncbi:aspartate/glutamate racemase family protein [Hydrogenophaga sp.]|uniref:aspartate/glutamate racemase family protein n=1 Tax=Hydrogenophaga sp. TaxID=1904254 RepID=UPI00286E3116|nr:aspartate/glutamate racemase family protein [Hydrogenophaga sp.]
MTEARAVAGGFLGVIVLDTRFPRPPGDIGCPGTWSRAGIPAKLLTVPGASARRVVQAQDPALLEPFIDAARALAAEGARLITTSCGFLAAWQAELQAAVNLPVISSSLLQCAALPAPGLVTFDAASLHPGLLRKAGVPEGTPVQGLAPGCELQSRILADDAVLDLVQAQADVVAAALQLVSRHPQVRTVVLECTNMPPYRDAVEQAIGRPVHDLETLLLARWRELRANV